MEKKFYLLHLIPPRPGFALDMNEEERKIMMQHVAYWNEFRLKGVALVYGPVMDPKGPYGLGIVAVDDEKQLMDLMGNDPARNLNRYEYFPMKAVLAEGWMPG